MTRLREIVPVKLRGLKSCGSVRIGNSFPRGRIVEAGKARKLISPSGGYRRGEALLEVAEKKKRAFHAELLSHEKQRRRRGEQQDCTRRAHRPWICDCRDSFPEGAIPHLIVILKKRYERAGRQTGAALAASLAISIKRYLALIIETFAQTSTQATDGMIRVI